MVGVIETGDMNRSFPSSLSCPTLFCDRTVQTIGEDDFGAPRGSILGRF